jgi:hypothetical protein
MRTGKAFSLPRLVQRSLAVRLRTRYAATTTDFIHAVERSKHTCSQDNQNSCLSSTEILLKLRKPCSWLLSTACLRTRMRLSRSDGADLRLRTVFNSMAIGQYMSSLRSQRQRRGACSWSLLPSIACPRTRMRLSRSEYCYDNASRRAKTLFWLVECAQALSNFVQLML